MRSTIMAGKGASPVTRLPRFVDDFEQLAKSKLSHTHYDYYSSGADEEITLRDSKAAFQRYYLRPRVLRDVSHVGMTTTVLGVPIAFPVCAAPIGLQTFTHPDGEKATVKGVSDKKTLFCMSCVSSTTIEDVALAAPDCLKWIQFNIFKYRQLAGNLVKRAEKAGFRALVVSVDLPTVGNRRVFREKKFVNSLRSQDKPTRFANYEMDDEEVQRLIKESNDPSLRKFAKENIDPSLTWKDVHWLKQLTSLPIVCKGILTAESAMEAADAGVNGLIVSAHGGRQLDGVAAPIDVLKEVVDAVRGRNIEIYVDGGVRTGTDVLKALALGARAVFVGRPIIWGLACGGTSGVKRVLDIYEAELRRAMKLCGCASIGDITPSIVKARNSKAALTSQL